MHRAGRHAVPVRRCDRDDFRPALGNQRLRARRFDQFQLRRLEEAERLEEGLLAHRTDHAVRYAPTPTFDDFTMTLLTDRSGP